MSEPLDLNDRRRATDSFLHIGRIQREITRLTAALFEKVGINDVTPAQANALVVLFQAREPLTARQLAEHLALSEVTVSRFVHALEQTGWIERERSPDDKRAFLLKPTAKAYDTLPRFIKVSNQLIDAAFEDFSREQLARMAGDIERVTHNLGRADGT